MSAVWRMQRAPRNLFEQSRVLVTTEELCARTRNLRLRGAVRRAEFCWVPCVWHSGGNLQVAAAWLAVSEAIVRGMRAMSGAVVSA